MRSKHEILQHLASAIEEITFGRVAAKDIKPSDRLLADLGLDSLDYATVMLGCERWTGVKLDENHVRWEQIDTLEKLAELFTSPPQ